MNHRTEVFLKSMNTDVGRFCFPNFVMLKLDEVITFYRFKFYYVFSFKYMLHVYSVNSEKFQSNSQDERVNS